MRRHDIIAIFICLGVFVASLLVSARIFEQIPHIEDEMAFVWQARVIAEGQIWLPSPQPNPDSFKVPFVIDHQGKRFGKYPPGWPALLAIGELLPVRSLINPLLTALSFWWMYRLASRWLPPSTSLLIIALGCMSPFVLMNGGSLLSHPWSLLLTVVFITAWFDAFCQPNLILPEGLRRTLPTLTAALTLGTLALTRPWTAVAIALPFTIHGIILFFTSDRTTRMRLGFFILVTVGISGLYLVWQAEVTGNPFINPYTLWWPYDRIGFGSSIGLYPGGYQLDGARANTLFSLFVANSDLFGWPIMSWLFIPWGLFAVLRTSQGRLISALLPSLVGAYALYWTPSWIYGPRYYYEALPAALILSAAGIRWLDGTLRHPLAGLHNQWMGSIRFILTNSLVCLLIIFNLTFYLPGRLSSLVGLSGITRDCASTLQAFSDEHEEPLLVFINLQKSFHEYSCTLDNTSPFQDSHLVTAISRDAIIDRSIVDSFPERTVFYYNPATREFSQPKPVQPATSSEIE